MFQDVSQLKLFVSQKDLDTWILGYHLVIWRNLSSQILCLSNDVGYLDTRIPIRDIQNFQNFGTVFKNSIGYSDNWIPMGNFQNFEKSTTFF